MLGTTTSRTPLETIFEVYPRKIVLRVSGGKSSGLASAGGVHDIIFLTCTRLTTHHTRVVHAPLPLRQHDQNALPESLVEQR